MTDRSYSKLQRYHTLEDRFEYLKLGGTVGYSTFGFDRHLNQKFYTSRQWRHVRNDVITRDLGCDLGIEGYDIHKGLYIHHMNPMIPTDIIQGVEDILDPEFLITCTQRTHNAIHYGDRELLPKPFIPRRPGDTKLW